MISKKREPVRITQEKAHAALSPRPRCLRHTAVTGVLNPLRIIYRPILIVNQTIANPIFLTVFILRQGTQRLSILICNIENTGINIAAFLDFFIPTCVHSIVSRVFGGLALGVRRAGEIHKLNVRCLGLDDIYISTGVVIHISNTRMRHKISPFKCLI